MLLGVWAGTARGVAGDALLRPHLRAGRDRDLRHRDARRRQAATSTTRSSTTADSPGVSRGSAAPSRCCCLTQLGAPLTVGFYAKFTVLAAVIDAGGGALALVALLSAAYRRLLLPALRPHAVRRRRGRGYAYSRAVADRRRDRLGVIVAILFGIWPGPLAAWVQHATLLFLP